MTAVIFLNVGYPVGRREDDRMTVDGKKANDLDRRKISCSML